MQLTPFGYRTSLISITSDLQSLNKQQQHETTNIISVPTKSVVSNSLFITEILFEIRRRGEGWEYSADPP